MAGDLAFTILPEAVRVRRVVHPSAGDRIVTTLEFTYEGEQAEGEVAFTPDQFATFITASLNALGIDGTDLEYISNRILKGLA